MFERMTQREAKKLMDSGEPYVLVDVRQPEEYNEGHIPGAILLPLGDVEMDAALVLPDQSALILVYCRSGRRSIQAALLLDELGYENVRDIGGIETWPFEIEK